MTDFTRESALELVFAEAFSKHGVGTMSGLGEDVGYHRMAQLIDAINYLADELSNEDHFSRELVAAMMSFVVHVPNSYPNQTCEFRSSLHGQLGELEMAATCFVENWDNCPEMSAYDEFDFTIADADALEVPAEECGGYQIGDITYCIASKDAFFPVRIIQLGLNAIVTEALDEGQCESICPEYSQHKHNRTFCLLDLPPMARFGGFDERPVNEQRESGPELRLLPTHYGTDIGMAIKEQHATDPDRWPLPTGVQIEQWFKD